ncbi:MAG: hypothetical protein PHE61_08375, partial [Candidatus Omnitrophica bacterium]|nr:hypothetical protein [Candidatus Omnitrophota bacterium]
MKDSTDILHKIWPAVVILLLVVVFFWPVTFEGKVLSGSDLLLCSYEPWNAAASVKPPATRPGNPELSDPVFSFVPNMIFSLKVLRGGKLPLWNPLRMCGSPQMGDGTFAVFYPVNTLFLLFPINPLVLATIKVLASLFLLGLFTYIYGREIDLNQEGALVAAVVVMFCSRTIAWLEFYSFLDATMWSPLILFCYERYIKRDKIYYLLWSCLLYGFSILASYPKSTIYFAQFLLVYVVFRSFAIRMPEAKKTVILFKSLFFFFLTVAVGAGIGAVEMLPLMGFSGHSARSVGISIPSLKELFVEIKNSMSSPNFAYFHLNAPWRLFPISSLMVPKFYGAAHDLLLWTKNPYAEWVIYVGVLPLILAVSAAVSIRNSFVKFFTWSAVITFALGIYTPVITQIYHFLNLGVISRMGALRTTFLSSFCLAFLAGFSVDSIAKQESLQRRKIIRCGSAISFFLIVVFAAIILLTLYKAKPFYDLVVKTHFFNVDMGGPSSACVINPPSQIEFIFYQVINFSIVILFSGLSLAYFVKRRTSNSLSGPLSSLCIGIIFLDLFLFGSKYNATVPLKLAYPATSTIEFLQQDRSLHRIYRYGNDKCLSSGAINAYGISDAGGRAMSLFSIKTYEFLTFIVPGATLCGLYPSYFYDPKGFGSPLLDLMNIKYVATSEKVPGLRSGNDDLKTAYDFIEHFPESEVKSYKGSNFIKESSVSVETFTIGD